MFNHNFLSQNIFNLNDDYMNIKLENDFSNHEFQKESNPYFSPNLLGSIKESTDPLIDYDNSEFSPLIVTNIANIENILSLEEEEDESIYNLKNNLNEKKSEYKSTFLVKKYLNRHKNINPIFKIKKMKKLGRIKKNSNKKGIHDKFQQDNIIRRFKVFFMRNIYKYINNSFLINQNQKKIYKVNILKRISSFHEKSISKKDNIKWFYSQIKDIFSQNLKKFICFDFDYNIKLINKIYEERKETKTIFILDKTIKELWLAYINDDKNNDFIGFETIKDDLQKLRSKGESEKYINLYVNIVNNFENIFQGINPRNPRKKNNYLNGWIYNKKIIN